ncbi:iron-containing redox enzyme family protein [Solirubrobacter sp. CPCC 204708]|uniref:Iron-containing redox enzyme family protein n=1 Tax=Solirubrobacter deserti TaxID=2282478 RepID=A0ABT4RDZ5_9ACTN|nr:iron-containing redox enzyme family protein [Solirubrobacter deserti]MBE2315993.1 iron-containing redox enzyme family protein [Solirubrobacter deserti]MDA0136745.1 iron-containing redox enzyme family protein [Solirubrobacter deserti]
MASLPQPRGPVSEALFAALRQSPTPLALPEAPFAFEDLQLALYCCYELHYRGFEGVDDAWEWDPGLLAFRAVLEREFEADVHELAGTPGEPPEPDRIDVEIRELMQSDDAPSVSTFIEREATREHVLEFLIHRSAYQLKEADPHSWAIPRLHGVPKAALVEIQADEYGEGRPDQVHAQLFARSMEALELDSTYGAYLDKIPGVTLATVNLMSWMGLHRRRRGGIVGHLALFEMTSSVPNRRYGSGLRRLGWDSEDAVAFFDVHVVADAVHESIAAVDLAGGLARQDRRLGADVLWGARALMAVDGRWARHMMERWEAGESSLYDGGVLAAQ